MVPTGLSWLRPPRVAVRVAALAVVLAGTLPAGVAAAAATGPPGAPATAPTAALATPVLSLRRVPQLLSVAVGMTKLDAALDATLSGARPAALAATSCVTVQYGSTTVYAHNPTLPVAPASNLKLLTMTAAVDKLPAADRFVTTVESAAAPVAGTVAGNLYLVGGGDPLLRTPAYVATLPYPEQIYDNLDTLAAQVRAAGVTKVTGSVVGDESRYDTQRYVPSWPVRFAADAEVGPESALEVNDGFAAAKAGPAAPQPAEQAAATFTALLQAEGITIAGPPTDATAPAGADTITQLASPPVGQVIDEVLRQSDDDGAELITKELAHQADPAMPTTAAGVAIIEADLAADGLAVSGLHMVDGSGLDPTDRATCQLILAVLLRSGPDGTVGQGLPVAGQSGTLYRRMAATPAAGRLRAKTGTLDGVAALSGFVTPAPAGAAPATSAVGSAAGSAAASAAGPGAPAAAPAASEPDLAFSAILNSVPSTSDGDALTDRIGVLLAQFPQAPPLGTLGPLG